MINKKVTGALLRILLVEDNPAHAELIIRSLEDHQIACDIFHAPDGEVAIDYLFRQSGFDDNQEYPLPHVILLDIRMPKVNGLQVLQEVKSAPDLRHIPIIILTTSDAEQDVDKAYEFHANSYLVKPVDFTQFMKLMEEFGFYWLSRNQLKLS